MDTMKHLYPHICSKIETGDIRLEDVPQLIASSQKLRQTLEWRPKLENLELMIRSACDWEQKLLNS
ncbi:MAG: hypothetical protein AB8C84_10935 [Oligoflexales bacterium]